MKGSELITQVRAELLESSAAFWTDAELLMWINLAENDYVNRTRLLEDKATMQTVSGQPDYPLPSNWLSTKMVWYHKPDDAGIDHQWQLFPTSLEKVAEETVDPLSVDTGHLDDPSMFWIWGRSLYLKAVPKTAGNTITMFYESKPIPLRTVDDSLNVDETLADGPRAYVLWHAWAKENETERAAMAKQDYMNAVRDGMRWKKKQAGNLIRSLDIRSYRPLQGSSRSTGSNPFFYNQ
jgi:hypothetical protein